MSITNYEQMNSMELDVLREIGSIGTGNAATALSTMLNKKIIMSMPEVSVLGYNEAINKMGGPEKIVAGVMSRIGGEVNGIMLYTQELDAMNTMLQGVLAEKIDNYFQLNEMEISAIIEVGNIIISSYMNAITSLANISTTLSVPGISINMLGGILAVPMVEYGYESNKILTIGGKLSMDDQEMESNLILLPDLQSLNYLFQKLGIKHE
ncbi:MAG: chemotaxis protein CheC [Peptostreptococcaceae bacterium]|nr:chemotaxis protein CheC [Peptostreptococcaceae bacterium]